MNNSTNHKINQVTEKTLVIGIDIAKRKHYACAVDDRGRVLHKSFPIRQSAEGFTTFYEQLLVLQNKHEKSEILVGFEPTGHYWMNLAAHLTAHDIRYVFVNPSHVKKSKELDDNLQTKNDVKDAMVIAKLIRDGRFSFPRILEGIEAELRNGASHRASLQKELGIITNRIIRWTDRFFPEFQHVFKDIGKTALAVLEKTPLPEDLREKEVAELLPFYKEVEGLKCVSSPKIIKLKEAAEISIGLTEGLEMARFEIHSLVMQYRLVEQQYELLAERLQEIAQDMPDYIFLLSIEGIGSNTAIELLSEVGPFTNFRSPRQIIKLAGLTLRENSSGEQKGQKKISKRGRKRLRAALFRAILPMIRYNPAFKALYHYYIERPVNPLRKKEAMMVLCGKLLKIAHGLCTKKQMFQSERMIQDLTVLQTAA
ncbi:IS110 family transposase [Psychrobacillus sp. MER TA 171]|uniref:IS110 family transposase n=1 Tax=Psychrobacillus sp. MER TA 171 TaxID=2939577 RepID=UPI00203E9B2A|nr:IS110 family transposase [Psychrobacillus sp. MER TA 171]MCM3359300.1 IS110 family transposase [Psychrobacillus sp. MER TA 171]